MTEKAWPDLQCLFTRASLALACPACMNNPRGITTIGGQDECPQCAGNHRNKDLIALLAALVAAEQDRLAKEDRT